MPAIVILQALQPSIPFVELARMGFHGVALVMLILGFYLLRSILKEQVTELRRRLTAIYVFLGISLVFFVVGVGSELYKSSKEDQQIDKITIEIRPDIHGENTPTLLKIADDMRETVEFDTLTSTFRTTIKGGPVFYLQLHTLTQKINKLQEQLAALRVERENITTEGGLDEIN